jgi:hypothetical protein
LVKEQVNLQELPTDKDGLVEAIAQYRDLPGVASRSAADRWSCAFVHDRGTVSLIRRTGEISNKGIGWVNESIGMWVGYRDKFLRGAEGIAMGEVSWESNGVWVDGHWCQ